MRIPIVDENDEIISRITSAVDVWAFGCILSYLFSGTLPWCNKYRNNHKVIQSVLMEKRSFPIPESIDNKIITKIIYQSTKINYKD